MVLNRHTRRDIHRDRDRLVEDPARRLSAIQRAARPLLIAEFRKQGLNLRDARCSVTSCDGEGWV